MKAVLLNNKGLNVKIALLNDPKKEWEMDNKIKIRVTEDVLNKNKEELCL